MKTALIAPIVVPKASTVLADNLRRLIVQGRLAPGDFLPAERELVAESGLSRTTVRDALRMLETEGLIATRTGRSGGSRVTLPGRASAARSFELFVRTHEIRLDSLLECRVAVEPMLARLAARNRTPAQLAEITDIHRRFATAVDDVPEYKRLNIDWHLAVARASGNEPLIALMEAISEPIADAQHHRHVTTPDIRAAAIKAHTVILAAIAEGNAEAAAKRMDRHVSAYRDIATGLEASRAVERA